MLEIIRKPPPNYDEICAAFPNAKKPGVYFCYGPAVWIPLGDDTLTPSLMAHEQVHADRQGQDPAGWWRRYIDDPQFRFEEELAAHIAEFRWFYNEPRRVRDYMLRQIAARLSGPLYGNLVTMHKAKQMITGKQNPDH